MKEELVLLVLYYRTCIAHILPFPFDEMAELDSVAACGFKSKYLQGTDSPGFDFCSSRESRRACSWYH